MEHLSKQQIILLALLVSLFTSIVTGVVVVSFSEQVRTGESKPITETVVRTIERVIQPATSTKEVSNTVNQNIVVTYEDRAAENLERVKPYVWYLESSLRAGVTMSLAIPLSTDGTFVAIKPIQGFDAELIIKDVQGTAYPVTQQKSNWFDLAVYKIATSTPIKTIPKTSIGADARLGQSVMSYGGIAANQTAGFGNITRVPPKTSAVNIPYGQSNLTQQPYGALLVSVDGKILGLQPPDQSGRYIPLPWLLASAVATSTN